MHERSRKRPRDLNELAKAVVSEATGEATTTNDEREKDPAAVELGRRGGLKGGPARASSLSSVRRKEIARRAALKRWGKEER
jgi:hypothetical protein